MNLKESLYLSATRWSRVCASIVSNRDIKLMNARARLVVKLLTVRDIIIVCYTMNVLLSNCLARTHKLSSHGLQTTPLPYVAATNSLTANDRVVYFQVVPVKIQGENGVAVIETFAILDDGSSGTLIRRDIADKLNLEGPEQMLCLGNIENNETPRSSRAVNLLVTPTAKQAVKLPV